MLSKYVKSKFGRDEKTRETTSNSLVEQQYMQWQRIEHQRCKKVLRCHLNAQVEAKGKWQVVRPSLAKKDNQVKWHSPSEQELTTATRAR
jgi:hypothetical protein